MNTIQSNEILTKPVKYFQVVYLLNLLPSILIKPLIIFIKFDKHYLHGSHWEAVCFSDFGYAVYFDSYALPPVKFVIIAYLQRQSNC